MTELHKPILITGATGSIGSALTRRLSASGQPVRALARSAARAGVLRALPGVEIFEGDLTRPATLRGCADGCGLVYHLGAKITGSDRAAFQAVNIGGTRALIAEAVRARVQRFVYASTITVYGFREAENIDEDFPWTTESLPYVATKQEAERSVRSSAGRLPLVVARLGDVYGPGQYVWTINFIEKINSNIMHPPTDGSSGTLNPVYIDNLIDALLLLGTHSAAVGQIFNVVDGTPIPASDYIRRMARMAGKNPFAVPGFVLTGAASLLSILSKLRGRESDTEGAAILLAKHTFSADKIRGMLGWQPAVGMDEAFRRTEVWLREVGKIR